MIRIDLEEPKDCVKCPFYDDDVCVADKEFRMPSRRGLRLEGGKPDWCPCVEVEKEISLFRNRIVSIWVDKNYRP